MPSLSGNQASVGEDTAMGTSSTSIDTALDLLAERRRDEEKFMALLVLPKLLSSSEQQNGMDMNAVLKTFERMNFKFLSRLLITGSTSSSTSNSKSNQQALLFKTIAMNVLASFIALDEFLPKPELISTIPFMMKALLHSDSMDNNGNNNKELEELQANILMCLERMSQVPEGVEKLLDGKVLEDMNVVFRNWVDREDKTQNVQTLLQMIDRIFFSLTETTSYRPNSSTLHSLLSTISRAFAKEDENEAMVANKYSALRVLIRVLNVFSWDVSNHYDSTTTPLSSYPSYLLTHIRRPLFTLLTCSAKLDQQHRNLLLLLIVMLARCFHGLDWIFVTAKEDIEFDNNTENDIIQGVRKMELGLNTNREVPSFVASYGSDSDDSHDEEATPKQPPQPYSSQKFLALLTHIVSTEVRMFMYNLPTPISVFILHATPSAATRLDDVDDEKQKQVQDISICYEILEAIIHILTREQEDDSMTLSLDIIMSLRQVLSEMFVDLLDALVEVHSEYKSNILQARNQFNSPDAITQPRRLILNEFVLSTSKLFARWLVEETTMPPQDLVQIVELFAELIDLGNQQPEYFNGNETQLRAHPVTYLHPSFSTFLSSTETFDAFLSSKGPRIFIETLRNHKSSHPTPVIESLLNILLASIVTMDNQPPSTTNTASLTRDLIDCIEWLPTLFVQPFLSNKPFIMTSIALGIYALKSLQKLDSKSREILLKPFKEIITMELRLLMDGLGGELFVDGNEDMAEMWFVTGNAFAMVLKSHAVVQEIIVNCKEFDMFLERCGKVVLLEKSNDVVVVIKNILSTCLVVKSLKEKVKSSVAQNVWEFIGLK